MMRAAPFAPLFALLSALPLAILGGCSSSDGGTRLYLLESAVTAQDAAPASAVPGVIVAAVRLPRYLDRAQIVTRSSEHRLEIAEFDLWAGDLGQDMTRALARNLSRLLASDRVVAAPHALRAADAFRVEVEVLAFERGLDGRVRLAARWWLSRGADPAPVAGTTGVELFGAPLAKDTGYEAVVASMSQVYGDFARQVAQAIRASAAGKP